MIISIYICFFFYIVLWGKAATIGMSTEGYEDDSNYMDKYYEDSIIVEESRPTNLLIQSAEGINSYRFLSETFKKKAYAFELRKDDAVINIHVWKSYNFGNTWITSNKLKCNSVNMPCDIMSSIIVDNELVLIYGNVEKYIIAKHKGGFFWDVSPVTPNTTWKGGKAIYYSGYPFSFPSVDSKKKYVLCYHSAENLKNSGETDIHTVVAACSISYDEGRTWSETYKLHVLKSLKDVVPSGQIYYFKGILYFQAFVEKKQLTLFACTHKEENMFYCQHDELDGNDFIAPFSGLHTSSEYMTYVSRYPKAYILNLSYKGHLTQDILLSWELSGRNIVFRTISTSEYSICVLYEKDKKIHVIQADIKKLKKGCEFIPDDRKFINSNIDWTDNRNEKEYTNRFFLDYENVQRCTLNSSDVVTDGKYKKFFVKVPKHVNFYDSDNCFRYSSFDTYWMDYGAKLIETSSLMEIDSKKNMKEYEFFFLKEIGDMFSTSDADGITCYSTDKKYKINFFFDDSPNYDVKKVLLSDSRDNAINKNVTLSPYDYKWNGSTLGISKGCYVSNAGDYLLRYQVYYSIIHYAPNMKNQLTGFSIRDEYTISCPKEGVVYKHAGVDLTNSSPYYEKKIEDISSNETIEIHVNVPESGKTIGLVCPKGQTPSDLFCFKKVLVENEMVSIQSVFNSVPVFVLPKRLIYNAEIVAVESLLYLNKDSYDGLVKMNSPVSFRCICKLMDYTVNVDYTIGVKKNNNVSSDTKLVTEPVEIKEESIPDPLIKESSKPDTLDMFLLPDTKDFLDISDIPDNVQKTLKNKMKNKREANKMALLALYTLQLLVNAQ